MYACLKMYHLLIPRGDRRASIVVWSTSASPSASGSHQGQASPGAEQRFHLDASSLIQACIYGLLSAVTYTMSYIRASLQNFTH